MTDQELINALKATDSKLCWHAAKRLDELLAVVNATRDATSEVAAILKPENDGGTD